MENTRINKPQYRSFSRSFINGEEKDISVSDDISKLKDKLPWGVNQAHHEVRFSIVGDSESFDLIEGLRRHAREQPKPAQQNLDNAQNKPETARPAIETSEVSIENLDEIARIAFFLGRPHKHNPFRFSVASHAWRSFYREQVKITPGLPSEIDLLNLFWARSADYSRTKHITKRAKWRLSKTYEAPERLTPADLPEVHEDRKAVLRLLCEVYDSTPRRQQGYFFANLYTLCLGLRDPSKDYLTALRLFIADNEVFQGETNKAFWNTGTPSVLLNNKKTRAILFNQPGYEVQGYDISNCFPVLLSQMLKARGIDAEYLNRYVSNRLEIISLLYLDKRENDQSTIGKALETVVSAIPEKDKSRIKQTILATIFGQERDETDHPFLLHLKRELKNITNEYFEGDPKALSYALYETLGRIQREAKEYWGADLIATICDCFYIRQSRDPNKTISEFRQILAGQGIDVQFGEKD